MEELARATLGGWAWSAPLGLALLSALLLHMLLYFVAERLERRTDHVVDTSLVRRTRGPARVLLLLLALQLVRGWLPLEEDGQDLVRHLLAIAIIVTTTWLLTGAVSTVDDVVLSYYKVDVADNLRARQVHTQTVLLTRSAKAVVLMAGLAAVLMTFPSVRQIGTGLLTSAGVAGLVAGFAARPVVGNLIAGVQLAVSQPIRLDDVVIVEGEWGWIEEITATYVVVKVWDQRRLIVPLSYFIEQPFQNWTRTTAELMGTAILHADYSVDVPAARAALTRILEDCPEWDRRVGLLQVVDTSERTVQLRALVSAAASGALWDLRCRVRERLLDYLQREQPGALPRVRAEVGSGGGTPPDPEAPPLEPRSPE